jgi:hypothetical protein
MAKINHDRPSLRLLDNYMREVQLQASTDAGSISAGSKKSTDGSMPRFSENARSLISLMIDAANQYLDHYSALLEAINPESGKSVRKKRNLRKHRLELSKEGLVDACAGILFEAIEESARNEQCVANWLRWLEREALRTKNDGLIEILEVGMNPAFERVSTAIDLP